MSGKVFSMDAGTMQKFFKDSWYVLLIIAVAMLANYNMVKDFKQLPSPLYGGDLWNHLGSMYHLVYGGSFFDSGELLGETPWVPRLYHLYQLLLSYISGWEQMTANIYNSIFLIPITAYAVWFLAKRFTDNKLLLAACVLLSLVVYPYFKYTLFAYHVMVPVLFVLWYLYLDKPDYRHLAALAAVMGLGALTNTQLFFAVYILLGVVALDKAHKLFIVEKKKLEATTETIEAFKPYLFIFALSFLISLIYWYWPLFVYHVQTPNDLQLYGWVDFGKIEAQLSYPMQKLSLQFTGSSILDADSNLNFNGIFQAMLRIAVVLGGALLLLKGRDKPGLMYLVYLAAYITIVFAYFSIFDPYIAAAAEPAAPALGAVVKEVINSVIRMLTLAGAFIVVQKRSEPKYRFAFLILSAMLLSLFHHLLTYNLFHIQLAPERLFEMYMWTFGVMLFAVAGEEAIAVLGKPATYIQFLLASLLIICVALVFCWNYMHWMSPPEGSFEAMAKQLPLSPPMLQLQGWILNNTGVYDVFLTDNEDAFMMNALTGRKSVSYRRTHTSTYADLDQRNLDSAVMLYGNNGQLRSSLLKKYKVKYLLWTSQWFSNQMSVDQQGRITRLFDPFTAKDSTERRAYMQGNNVSFLTFNYYLDPAYLRNYPTYDLIIVPPQGKSALRPWGSGMDNRLTELYRITYTSAPADYPPFAVIYGVKLD